MEGGESLPFTLAPGSGLLSPSHVNRTATVTPRSGNSVLVSHRFTVIVVARSQDLSWFTVLPPPSSHFSVAGSRSRSHCFAWPPLDLFRPKPGPFLSFPALSLTWTRALRPRPSCPVPARPTDGCEPLGGFVGLYRGLVPWALVWMRGASPVSATNQERGSDPQQRAPSFCSLPRKSRRPVTQLSPGRSAAWEVVSLTQVHATVGKSDRIEIKVAVFVRQKAIRRLASFRSFLTLSPTL
ncbi:hypothetical protein EDB85DRAFT_963340 [Lactarius pseudohatsudake]|nr:hypothetical protein EDB85DRAFT_963340 [Lactarius pseudohatsudake]